MATRATLGLTQLETREVMSGNVTATVTGGLLRITGDGSANSVEVRGGEHGSVRVTGVNTTVNGRLAPSFLGGVTAVRIELNGGADTVKVYGETTAMRLPKDLRVYGGDGNDRVDITMVNVDDVYVDTGKGNDRVNLALVEARDDIDVVKSAANKGDYDIVRAAYAYAGTDPKQHGHFYIDTKDGADSISLDAIGGDELRLRTYGGNDVLHLGENSFPKKMAAWDAGSGSDTLNLYLDSAHDDPRLGLLGTSVEKVNRPKTELQLL